MSTDKIPDGWTRVKFGEIAASITERVDDPSTAGVDRYIGLEHLDPDSIAISRWGSPSDVESTKLRFYPGDVIYGRRRAYQRKLGVADFEGICSAHALVLRAKPLVCLPEFLPYFLQSDAFHQRALDISVGSLSPTINWKTLAVQEFALPPLDEQRKAVEILDASGGVEKSERAALAASISEVSALLRSMTESGEPTTLGALAGSGIQIGPFGSQLHVSDYIDDGVPVVMPADLRRRGLDTSEIRYVAESKAQELSSHRLCAGDIVLPRRGELDKRTLISHAEVGWLCGTGSVRVRLQDPTLAPLVLEILASRASVQWLNVNAVGTTMPNVNRDIVARIPLLVPPPKSREAWVKRLKAARALSEALAESVHMSVRRSASLREALLGGCRVR